MLSRNDDEALEVIKGIAIGIGFSVAILLLVGLSMYVLGGGPR